MRTILKQAEQFALRFAAEPQRIYREIRDQGFLTDDLRHRWNAVAPNYKNESGSPDADPTLAHDLIDALSKSEYGSYAPPQHPPGGMGRHWSRSKDYAFQRSKANGGTNHSLVLEADWDGQGEDPSLSGVGSSEPGHYKDEQEATLQPGAHVTVRGLHIVGDPFYPHINILREPVEHQA